MDSILEFLKKWWDILRNFLQQLTPDQKLMAAVGFGVLLLLLILRKLLKVKNKGGVRSKNNKKGALSIHSYQIAPLGRDAFLKIKNNGPSITLTQLVINNQEVSIKNALAGQKIDEGKIYSILLESKNTKKIPEALEIEITFLNSKHIAEKQTFTLTKK